MASLNLIISDQDRWLSSVSLFSQQQCRMHITHMPLHCGLLVAPQQTELTLKLRWFATLLPLVAPQVTSALVGLGTVGAVKLVNWLLYPHHRIVPEPP